jgi:hypothetical protein
VIRVRERHTHTLRKRFGFITVTKNYEEHSPLIINLEFAQTQAQIRH